MIRASKWLFCLDGPEGSKNLAIIKLWDSRSPWHAVTKQASTSLFSNCSGELKERVLYLNSFVLDYKQSEYLGVSLNISSVGWQKMNSMVAYIKRS